MSLLLPSLAAVSVPPTESPPPAVSTPSPAPTRSPFVSSRRSAERFLRPGPSRPRAPSSAGLPPDTITPEVRALLRRVRALQRRFERERREAFPVTDSRGGGRCDELVGRFCFRHEDRPDPGRPEPDRIRTLRFALLSVLDEAAAHRPGDGWVAGQRVRYRLEAGDPEGAVGATRACRAGRAWCRALLGFAHHLDGRHAAAGRAFREALDAMEPARRRAWLDPTLLLDGTGRGALERLAPAARDRAVRWLWWLADPLYTVPGNDRLDEHLARRVWDSLQVEADGPHGVPWGDDLRELLLRYGWPRWWERERIPPHRIPDRIQVVAHHDPRGRRFLPTGDGWAGPGFPDAGDWRIHDPRPPSDYAPVYLDSLSPLDHWTALFRRGDSLRLVLGYRSRDDAAAEVLLAVAEGPDGTLARDRGAASGPTGVLTVRFPARPVLLAAERLQRAERWAERARYGIAPDHLPEGEAGLSDLLPLKAPARTDGLPSDLEEAIGSARPPGPYRTGDRVSVFWEAYGLPSRLEGMEVRVVLGRSDGGFLSRLGRGLGLGGEAPESSLRWRPAPVPGASVHPGAVSVALPREAGPGRYLLEVALLLPGREPITSRRMLEVAEPPG